KRPVVYIPKVMLHALFHFLERVSLAPISVNLRPARNSRLDLMTLHVRFHFVLVILVMRQSMRPGADDGHAALQYIVELWELIQTGSPQEGAQASNTRVAI